MEMNIEEIKDKLTLRYPYLLVDRVTQLNEDGITAIKNVTVNEPYFQGHFPDPDRSIMPGTMIIESMAQASGILAGHRSEEETLGYLTGVDGARFRSFVRPGDQLVLNGTHLKARANIHKVQMEGTVDETTAAEATIILTIGAKDNHD